MIKLTIVFALIFGVITHSMAQIKDPKIEKTEKEQLRAMVVVYTKTGEIYKGYFISQNKDFLEIENETVGRITIPTSRIEKIVSADSNDDINIVPEREDVYNINAPKYFFGSSGFNFEKGGNYLSNNVLTYHRGLSDNFSIGVGTSLVSLVLGSPIFYINPHYTYSFNDKLHFKLGIDALIGTGGDGGGAFSAGLINTGLTIGTPDLNITGTIYYGAVSGVGIASQPAFTLAGSARVSRQLSIITENVLLQNIDFGGYFIGSYGVRYLTANGSYDLFFINNRDISQVFVVGFPLIGFTLKL
jgi:hypothetical protein